MKKILGSVLIVFIMTTIIAGCSKVADSRIFNAGKDITVVSREDGSGTRGAFTELFGIIERGTDGSRKDLTIKKAIITSKTDVVMVNIGNDPHAIGYISLGSMNDMVKALKINGTTASADNVKNGSYTVFRPFNIAVKGEPSGLTKDFIDFIMAAEGQKVAANSYIAIDDQAPNYAGDKPRGKIVVAGSSSVSPLMELLKETYENINPGAKIEIQTSDSTAGLTGVTNGTCDIGMASRNLKPAELETLTEITIALDGIVIIVNNNNPTENMTKEQVRSIFIGEITKWNDIGS